MKLVPLIFLCFLVLFGCKSESSTEQNSETTNSNADANSDDIKATKLHVGLDHLRLRASPGEDGEEIAFLEKETVLYETGEVSDFTSRIKLRGIWFDEPWIKVKTDKGVEGWVYGGAVNFEMQNPTKLANQLLEIRLNSFFGKAITNDLHSYRKAYYSANTSEDFSKLFKMGKQLRDTMVTILEQKIEVMNTAENQLPDLFWIEEAMPGYETALVAEGTVYYLFQNLKDFQKITNKTSGSEDDDFLNLLLKVHAADSIEYFYPAWFLQTWDYGGHSLLGQGIHLDILQTADITLKKSNMFIAEIIKIKEDIVNDIVGTDISYWEPAENIRKELDDILAADPAILVNTDKIAIATRRKMFDDPKENNIEVNKKSGME